MGRRRPPRATSRLLWTVQGLLAALFLFAGGMKLVTPIAALTQQIALPGLFLRFIGLVEVLGALGLILPGLLRIRPALTPLAAADPGRGQRRQRGTDAQQAGQDQAERAEHLDQPDEAEEQTGRSMSWVSAAIGVTSSSRPRTGTGRPAGPGRSRAGDWWLGVVSVCPTLRRTATLGNSRSIDDLLPGGTLRYSPRDLVAQPEGRLATARGVLAGRVPAQAPPWRGRGW